MKTFEDFASTVSEYHSAGPSSGKYPHKPPFDIKDPNAWADQPAQSVDTPRTQGYFAGYVTVQGDTSFPSSGIALKNENRLYLDKRVMGNLLHAGLVRLQDGVFHATKAGKRYLELNKSKNDRSTIRQANNSAHSQASFTRLLESVIEKGTDLNGKEVQPYLTSYTDWFFPANWDCVSFCNEKDRNKYIGKEKLGLFLIFINIKAHKNARFADTPNNQKFAGAYLVDLASGMLLEECADPESINAYYGSIDDMKKDEDADRYVFPARGRCWSITEPLPHIREILEKAEIEDLEASDTDVIELSNESLVRFRDYAFKRARKEPSEYVKAYFSDSAQKLKKFYLAQARPRQAAFRDAVLKRFGGKCWLTDCDLTEALEAAHIRPFASSNGDALIDHVDNGIALRRDIHSLFDAGLIEITPSTSDNGFLIKLSGKAKKSNAYADFAAETSKYLPKACNRESFIENLNARAFKSIV